MTTRYDPDLWADRTTRGRGVLNVGFQMTDGDLPDWHLIKTVAMEVGHDPRNIAHLWQGSEDPDRRLLRVSVVELDDWRAAQWRLREALLAKMHPDIPPGSRELRDVGDVVYVARERVTDIPASISFTRGNMLIEVASVGRETVDVSEVARQLDQALGVPPDEADLAQGRVEAQVIEVQNDEPGARRTIITDLTATAPESTWCKAIASSGELLREGSSLRHRSPDRGTQLVEVFIRRLG